MKYSTALLRGVLLVSALVVPLGFNAANSQTAGSSKAADPKAYAIRIPVTPVAGAPLQRLVLPAEALVKLQSADYADLRIFNAQGQAVAMALASSAVQARTEEQQFQLPAYPIVGPASVNQLDGMSLRIEETQGRRFVRVDTHGAAAGATAGASTQAQKVLGVLIDARAVNMPVASMRLDVDLPVNQPITLYVQSSKDLKTWQSLAETVLYRPEAAVSAASTAATLGSDRIDLAMADLAKQYLRVSWGDAKVSVRSASLTTSRSAPPALVNASMAPPVLANAHELSFALPFATPVAALKITPQGSNVLIPVRVLGRNDRNQPWTPLASGVVYRLVSANAEQLSAPVPLGASVREVKIEADAKTPGFSAAPEITLQFEPTQVVFLASGDGPFTLAAGLPASARAASAYLPIASLIPGYQVAEESALPLAEIAKIEGASAAGPLVTGQAASTGVPTRTLVLWGVLLAGALALGLMAWVLLRQARQGGPVQSEDTSL